MSYESENMSMLFMLLFHVLKFKIYLIELSLILSSQYMDHTRPSFECVVGTWVCVLVFLEARTMGDCPSFLTHPECTLSVVSKTHRQ